MGDQVEWTATGDEGVITKVKPRRNLFYRQDEIRTKSFAANLDTVLVLIAVQLGQYGEQAGSATGGPGADRQAGQAEQGAGRLAGGPRFGHGLAHGRTDRSASAVVISDWVLNGSAPRFQW